MEAFPEYTVGFYNLENLFDTRNHPELLDDDFTPRGFKRWTHRRYRNKLYKLGRAIAHLGQGSQSPFPVLLGVAELENRRVLEDLLRTEWLQGSGLEIVHYDSPDERGIDTGLLFHRDYFTPDSHQAIPLLVYEVDGRRDYTRDILHVSGTLNGERVHVLVNHWPSRRDGADLTAHKRLQAAKTLLSLMQGIAAQESDPNFLIMGDFNDDPYSDSIRHLLGSAPLHNPMEGLLGPERGSANYKRSWMLFDQIMLSSSFLQPAPNTHSFAGANIFDPKFLKEWSKPFKGKPFRTYVGRKYLGGYSDHFPVYVRLRYHP